MGMSDIQKFGSLERPYIIAEVGNNHLGDVEIAHKSIDAAVDAGVDAVKFQLFDPDLLITASEPVLKHVPANKFSTQRERFRHMVLEHAEFESLARHCAEASVAFLCTPFDPPSADFLDTLVPAFKIASGDSSNFALIDHVTRKGKPMMASTGLCEQDEVDELVSHLPADRSLIFHCIGAYPTPDADANLALIPFYRERYGLSVGFSDHTTDPLASLAAVALGATIIEKHFILDRTLPGGDRDLSLDAASMHELVKGARRIASMRGTMPRTLTPSEAYGREKLRRSAYAKRAIHAGERFGIEDVVLLRPEISGAHSLKDVLDASGLIATADITPESVLTTDNTELL